jgi:hypothetical protein
MVGLDAEEEGCLPNGGLRRTLSSAFRFLADERNEANSFLSGGSGNPQLRPSLAHLVQQGIRRQHFNYNTLDQYGRKIG